MHYDKYINELIEYFINAIELFFGSIGCLGDSIYPLRLKTPLKMQKTFQACTNKQKTKNTICYRPRLKLINRFIQKHEVVLGVTVVDTV